MTVLDFVPGALLMIGSYLLGLKFAETSDSDYADLYPFIFMAVISTLVVGIFSLDWLEL